MWMRLEGKFNGILLRLNRLSPWAFTGSLYLLRWAIIVPLAALLRLLGQSGGRTVHADPVIELLGGVLLSPLVETVIECVIPYWSMRKMLGTSVERRPWIFVVTSATMMTLSHMSAWPAAIVPSFVTGSFLAYTYGHLAASKSGTALLHTWTFHAAINIVGWVFMVFF